MADTLATMPHVAGMLATVPCVACTLATVPRVASPSDISVRGQTPKQKIPGELNSPDLLIGCLDNLSATMTTKWMSGGHNKLSTNSPQVAGSPGPRLQVAHKYNLGLTSPKRSF